MMAKVTIEELERCTSEAMLKSYVGKRLARLWSKHGAAPLPATERGLMLVLLERRSKRESELAQGLILPLKWAKCEAHDGRLPARLLKVADEVRDKIEQTDKHFWWLSLADGIKADLSGLDEDVSWESAWTTLAAGLIVASQDGRPDVCVVATAAYDVGRDEALGVDGIEAKLGALAAVARPDDKPFVVFVAASNVEQARKVVRERGWDEVIQVEAYPVRSSAQDQGWDLRTVLQPQLDRLAVPPDDPAKKVNWINEASLSRAKRDAYYMEVVDELAEKLRLGCSARVGGVSTLLVAVSDGHYSQAALLALALCPARVLITYSGRSRRQADRMIKWLTLERGWSQERIMLEEVSDPPKLDEVARLYEALDRDALVDITGGTRATLWAMTEASERGGVRRTYISHKDPGNVKYGEERLLIHDEIFGTSR